MGLKKAENQVKILLADTIMALCRNTLNHHSEISVEGLLGITLDNDEIFLVSIDQTISNPDVPSKKRSLEKDSKQTDESKSKRAKDDEDTEIEDEQQEKKSKRRKRRRSRRRGSNVSGGISSDNEDGSDSARPHSDHDVVSNDASFTDDQTNSGNNSSIRIKSETNEDDDEDLVIVKEELGDEAIPSTADFPFMAQSFHNFQHLADSPLNNFQPHSSTQAHSQQSMVPSSQPQPGPSVNPPGVSEEDGMFDIATDVHSNIRRSSLRTQVDCLMCGKPFQSQNKLKRHMIVHTGAKFYTCAICMRQFGIKSSLKRHWINVHKRPFIEPFFR